MDALPTTRPGSVDRSFVRTKALAVLLDDTRERHVVFRMADQSGQEFNRPLGGSIELGEHSRTAVVREIREELGATFEPEGLLGVFENIFELDGESGHEIDFVYVGRLAERDVVPDDGRPFDDVGTPGWAEWRSVDDPPATVPLYPPGLQERIAAWLSQPPGG